MRSVSQDTHAAIAPMITPVFDLLLCIYRCKYSERTRRSLNVLAGLSHWKTSKGCNSQSDDTSISTTSQSFRTESVEDYSVISPSSLASEGIQFNGVSEHGYSLRIS